MALNMKADPLKLEKGRSTTELTPDLEAQIRTLKNDGKTWNEIRGFLGDPHFNGSKMRAAHQKANEGSREYPWRASRAHAASEGDPESDPKPDQTPSRATTRRRTKQKETA